MPAPARGRRGRAGHGEPDSGTGDPGLRAAEAAADADPAAAEEVIGRVVPAQAGTHTPFRRGHRLWVPVFARTTALTAPAATAGSRRWRAAGGPAPASSRSAGTRPACR